MSTVNTSENNSKRKPLLHYVIAILITLIILVGSGIAVVNINGNIDYVLNIFNLKIVILFYIFASLTYLLNARIWYRFNIFFGSNRMFFEAAIDTGLMSLGKYAPGKVWGVMLRGRSNKGINKIDSDVLFLSFFELAYSFSAGLVVAVFCLLLAFLNLNILHALSLITIFVLVLALFFGFIWDKALYSRARHSLNRKISLVNHLEIMASYLCLWALTTIPFVLIVDVSNSLTLEQNAEVAASFIVSVIVGWLALIAPAGVGVRESVFTVVSQGVLDWKDALAFIAAHRILLTLFDLAIGACCLTLMASKALKK